VTEYEVTIMLRAPRLVDALAAINHASSFPDVKLRAAKVEMTVE
jgi:hypothetical protein